MSAADDSVKILLRKITLLFPIQESKQCKWVKIGGIGECLPIGFDGLVEEDNLSQNGGEGGSGFDGEHVLLVIGH